MTISGKKRRKQELLGVEAQGHIAKAMLEIALHLEIDSLNLELQCMPLEDQLITRSMMPSWRRCEETSRGWKKRMKSFDRQ